MKILKLQVEKYKLFEPLTIDFKESSHIAVFIGKNGSGKTTLIEVFTHIFSILLKNKDFRSLDKVQFPFAFSISYLLRKEKISQTLMYGESHVNYIGVEIEYDKKINIKLHEGTNTFEGVNNIEKHLRGIGEDLKYILPDNFTVYYSGISDSILNVFNVFQQDIILGTLTGDIEFDQPFYYFIPSNLPAILIALLSFEYGDVPEHLRSQFGITGFSEIKLIFKKPDWAKSKTSSADFWGAMGELNQFMNILNGNSDATFASDSVTFKIDNHDQLKTIWSFYGTEKRLFEYLVSLQANGFLNQIELSIIKNDKIINFHNLSEGEKQLLIISGLKELLAADNSLFLLDEPDTFLHPEWKRQFVYDLFKEENDLFKSFSIITTHSPNIISALKKGQLNILFNENGKSRIKEISFNPYGKPVDDILIDFFDVESLRYIKVQDKLNELWDLIKNGEFEENRFLETFSALEKDLGKSDKALTEIRIEIAKRKKQNEIN